MKLELNEREIKSLRNILEEIFETLYQVNHFEDTQENNEYYVECIDLNEDDFNLLVRLGNEFLSKEQLRNIVNNIDPLE